MPAGPESSDCGGPPRGMAQIHESRRSFHRQVEQLQDIHDKAMRSVRTAVVVIGFVVTAVGVAARTGRVGLGVGPAAFTALGVFFLAVTVLAGVGTYSVTEYPNRLTDAERARLEQPSGPNSDPTAELTRIYRSWLDATGDELAESATFLAATLSALAVGILSLSVAAVLAVLEAVVDFETLSLAQVVALNLGTTVSVLLAIGVATTLTIRGVNGYL